MASIHLTPEEAANYYQTKQPAIVATSVVFLIISNVSVLVRILSQLRLSKRLFVDDFAIVFAALCSDVIGALFLNATTNGLGLHIYRVLLEDPNPPQHTIALFKDLFLTALLTGPYFLAIKISLLWYYRRSFLVHQRWLLITWWINLVYIILWAVSTTIFYIFQCRPPHYYWLRLFVLFKIDGPSSPVSGTCHSASPVLLALPLIFNFISDFGILLLPVTTLLRLQMRTRSKLGLMAVFSLGLLACVCGIVRIWLEVTISAFEDPTYANVTFGIFTFAEGNIAIAAACLPIIASQWQYLFKNFQTVQNNGSGDSIVSLNPRQDTVPESTRASIHSQDQMDVGSQEGTG